MKTLKFLPVLAALCLSGNLVCEAAIIARWSFNESSGTLVDDSIGSLNGTLSPQGSSFVAGGISGNALALNRGLNGFVTMGNVLGFSTQPFSVVVWVKTAPGYSIGDSEVFSKHLGFSHNGYWMLLNQTGGGGATGKALFGEGSTVRSVISTTTVNDGNWHQIVTTWQPGVRLSIYVDGAPVENTATASASLITNNAAFLIGAVIIGTAPEGRYTGLVDEMQVYNHVLTPEQVNFLFANPTETADNCGDLLAAAQAQLTAAQAQLAAAQVQLTNTQAQLAVANSNLVHFHEQLTLPIQLLTLDLQTTFRNPQFQIPGNDPVEQFQNLIMAIGNLNVGQRQGLYFKLISK